MNFLTKILIAIFSLSYTNEAVHVTIRTKERAGADASSGKAVESSSPAAPNEKTSWFLNEEKNFNKLAWFQIFSSFFLVFVGCGIGALFYFLVRGKTAGGLEGIRRPICTNIRVSHYREENVYLAKLAEQAERYDEMADYMKHVAESQELSLEERNLLSVAYKHAVGSRRASWRIISSVEQKEKSRGYDDNLTLASQYKQKVEREIQQICEIILELLDDYLISNSLNVVSEFKVFYYTMKGDYYRYIAEFAAGECKTKAADSAHEAYKDATAIAASDLVVTHPTRLCLALSYSVFYYEVLNNADEACKIARSAFEEAIAELDNVSKDSYEDSTLIMQLLRDNLTLWTSDQPEEADAQ